MNAVFTQSAAQNDTCGVVILNEVKDLILKLSHYLQLVRPRRLIYTPEVGRVYPPTSEREDFVV
jgi:hypothetical protein